MEKPYNDKLYKEMKYVSKKYFHLDKFERESDSKFIENSSELLKVGNEIFDNFDLSKVKIKLFADICSAPGMYSKILLDKFHKTIGIGVSLPIEEGGVAYEITDKRYKTFYKNILEKNYKLEITKDKKLDLGMASCVSYQHDAKNAFYLNMELIIKSLMLILSNLKNGGHLIINLTIKNINLAFNLVRYLASLFNQFKIWKSETVWATKNTFYFFGYDFKNNYFEDDLKSFLDNIRNKEDQYNNKFTGNKEEYDIINKQMRNIYLVRIKALKNLAKNSLT